MNMDEQERYEGTWKGRQVSFKRVYRGHRLTDSECEQLCRGLEIEVKGLKSKSGGTYGSIAVLEEMVYNGHTYVGVQHLRFPGVDARTGIPDEWCQHKFTEDEKLLLESGHRLEISGCVSKKGNTFDVAVTWEEDENGRMKIKPHFT